MFKKVIKDTSIFVAGTLTSRILGFIRDILLANFFGASKVLEAFIVSFRLPNIFRSIFGEGFADSVATPVLSEYSNQKGKLFSTSNYMLSILTVLLVILTLLGIIFAKYLVIIIAPGFFILDKIKFNLAVSFTRITFVYLLFIGLSSSIISVLSSLRKFFVPAITPIFLNISFIIGIIFFSRFFKNYILVICVLVAGILQLIFPIISLKRAGFSFKFNLISGLRDSEIFRMFKLFIPRVWSSLVYHLSVFIDTAFSSLAFIVGEGAVASVYYADRLIQFPFALIAISVSRVAIVDLSSYHRQGNMEDFKKLFVFSFQNIIFFIIPAAVIFAFLSQDILSVVFFRGKFDVESLKMTSSVFFFYSFGLFFFCAIRFMVNAFYSLKDTSTPTKTAAISLIANIILSAILMFPLKIGGVALGSSLAAMLNFFLLKHYLDKKIGRINWQDTRSQTLRIILLSLLVGIISRISWDFFTFNKYFKTLMTIGLVSSIYIGGGYVLGLKQINYLKRWILKKR